MLILIYGWCALTCKKALWFLHSLSCGGAGGAFPNVDDQHWMGHGDQNHFLSPSCPYTRFQMADFWIIVDTVDLDGKYFFCLCRTPFPSHSSEIPSSFKLYNLHSIYFWQTANSIKNSLNYSLIGRTANKQKSVCHRWVLEHQSTVLAISQLENWGPTL